MSDIRHQLRDLRVKEGVTQTDLAKSVGLNRTSITNIESLRQKLTMDNLICIADALDYRVEVKFVKRR
ncbi:helix-turn-helix transcriptional regulator [Paraburkholderia acidisoli]|uniref:Helix-turn-helix domain-containing protein n=1 Tax=Paraburkholderia acidisoli TaxID=2571748 RepID=A0A7Z2GRJ8_9BURK|nr:helix-turn-helix domain-containing protein [Paraburkholderia acidisoli]QGZ66404.1 helix-turn-helix domain-containing protein [Paraburkholderia acidisoli]